MDCSCTSHSSSTSSERSLSFLLEQAAGLNEDGVYELSSGKSREAILLFQEAWESLMEATQLLNTAGRSAVPTTTTTTTTSTMTTSRIQIPHLEDELVYIYACAVSYTPTSTNGTANVEFECAIVLFNLALALHQQGKKLKKEGLLQRARHYYQQCQQALQQALETTCTGSTDSSSTGSGSIQHDELILLTLAVMNNQASIEYQYELPPNHTFTTTTTTATTTTSPEDCFQKLWHYSLHAILAEDTTNFSMVEQAQIHEFVQNAMVFRLQRPCAAPTA